MSDPNGTKLSVWNHWFSNIKQPTAEHAPPHFHAIYGEFKAAVDIRSLSFSEGNLPRQVSSLVLDWAELHQTELLNEWDLCQTKQQPKPIEPLK